MVTNVDSTASIIFTSHDNNYYRRIGLTDVLAIRYGERWTGFGGMPSSAASVWASTVCSRQNTQYISIQDWPTHKLLKMVSQLNQSSVHQNKQQEHHDKSYPAAIIIVMTSEYN
jgi:hypothetical protein